MMDRTWRFRSWWMLGLTLLLATASLEVRAEPSVERVSFLPGADGSSYVIRIHLSKPVRAYSAPRVVDGGEIELVLFETSLSSGFRAEAPIDPLVGCRTITQAGRLVLRFRVESPAAVAAAAYPARDSDDLLVELSFAAPAPEPALAPVRHVSDAGSTPDTRQRWRLDTIVIDPGHGGVDEGAMASGLMEKDITLAVGRKLGRLIEENTDVDVIFTREDDRFVGLRERGRLANEAGGKLLISLHVNASANGRSARGTETYFLGMHKGEAARNVMERENSVIRFETDPEVYLDFDERALILRTMAQSAYMAKSEQLAAMIEDEFSARLGRNSRGVKQAGFYVLWSASMPSILVELGFITNPADAAFMQSDRGQDHLADAIFRAVRDFKERYDRDLNFVNGQ
jgi:N-acetylmuramoyl-L-alanine amidase